MQIGPLLYQHSVLQTTSQIMTPIYSRLVMKHMYCNMKAVRNNLQTETPVWIEITLMIMIVDEFSSNNKAIKNFLVGEESLL
jgi:hypothetical protein